VDRPKQQKNGKPNGRAAPPPTESIIQQVADEADRVAYIRVLQDKREGRTPKRADLRAASRFEAQRDLRLALAFVQSVPRRFLNQWAGIQNIQIDQAADRYGVPVRGPVWSVPEFVRWLFRFLAKNGRYIFRAQVNGDAIEDGPDSPWLEELRKERTLMERIKRRELERSLVSIHTFSQAWQLAGAAVRVGCEQMKREHLDRAVEIYGEALDNAERRLERFFDDVESFGDPEADDGVAATDAELYRRGPVADGSGNGREPAAP